MMRMLLSKVMIALWCCGVIIVAEEPPSLTARQAASEGNTLDDLVLAFENSIRVAPRWPAITGYCGWNYECATMIYALQLNVDQELGVFQTTQSDIHKYLQDATKFPQPGFWIWFAPFLLTPGDRIGLFGGLYHSYPSLPQSTVIVDWVNVRLQAWPKQRGLFARNFGWGFLFGVNIIPLNLWIDDSFIGGSPLIHTNINEYGQLLIDYHTVFRDEADGLYWHGRQLGVFSNDLSSNGIKWGRGNSWLLLALSVFLLESKDTPNVATQSQVLDILKLQIDTLVGFQRSSGAFGNVVNDSTSVDETSLASVFVFACAVLDVYDSLPSEEARIAANAAWDFVKTRTTDPSDFRLADTSAGQRLSSNPADYSNNVGLSSGPGAALALYAIIGKELLGFV